MEVIVEMEMKRKKCALHKALWQGTDGTLASDPTWESEEQESSETTAVQLGEHRWSKTGAVKRNKDARGRNWPWGLGCGHEVFYLLPWSSELKVQEANGLKKEDKPMDRIWGSFVGRS